MTNEQQLEEINIFPEEISFEAAKEMTQEERLMKISEAGRVARADGKVPDLISVRSAVNLFAAERHHRTGTRGATKRAHNEAATPSFDLKGLLDGIDVGDDE